MSIDVNCDGPRLAAGDRPQSNCLESLARTECGLDDLCSSCLRLAMTALDWVANTELPWHANYRVAAGISQERPGIRDRVASRFATLGRSWYRATGGAA